MNQQISSRERLHRLYFHETMDRPAVIIRGQLAGLFGSEPFALFSILERDLMHRLLQREFAIKRRLVAFLVRQGVGPYFHICGQEMIAPPRHGRDDFLESNVRYDQPIAAAIHAAGGRLNVHCHGRLRTVLDGFVDIGVDVVHCFAAPPMGDVTPAEAEAAWRGRTALAGNIQIADLCERSPAAIRAQVEALIRAGFDDSRGLAISPTASPFMPGRGADCYPQYAAMVAAVHAFGTHGARRLQRPAIRPRSRLAGRLSASRRCAAANHSEPITTDA